MALISLRKTWRRKIRKAGYLKDQNGIIRRYHREPNNWNIHIEKCKEFITKITYKTQGGKLAILGSGWLLDIPINFLEKKFDEIWLIDINHPIQVKRKYEKHKNIHFIETDLTNGLVEKAVNLKSYKEFVAVMNGNTPMEFGTDFNLVISINILNQLDILLCDFLQKKFKLSNELLIEVRKKVQQDHINLLKRHNACLITDCKELLLDEDNVIEVRNLLYCDLPKATNFEQWIWVFDTKKHYHVKYNTSFKVKALSF